MRLLLSVMLVCSWTVLETSPSFEALKRHGMLPGALYCHYRMLNIFIGCWDNTHLKCLFCLSAIDLTSFIECYYFSLFSLFLTDMRRDVQEIFRMTPHEKQVMMFSATLSKEIRPVCRKFMQDVSYFIDFLIFFQMNIPHFSQPEVNISFSLVL